MLLYDFPGSPNTYKVRLLLEFLDLDYDTRTVDIMNEEQNEDWFREINPRGQVPALEDGDLVLWDSQAILLYLAEAYDDKARWWPRMASDRGEITQWLTLAADEHEKGVGDTMRIEQMGIPGDPEFTRKLAARGFRIMQEQLATNEWLALASPTLADVACYPWTRMASVAEVSLKEYPAIRDWMDRFENLNGYLPPPQSESN